MNLLVWPISLALLVILLAQAVEFQRSTVCRQEAWRKSFELATKATLSHPSTHERDWHIGCRLHLVRNQDTITWQRLPKLKAHHFELLIKGKL